ncbi:MAG TPA: 6,7-dimethyl-8-ribityllumazine synthase [Balneolaceae bacterium]|nr:6,7-dimethyl-8-ribityllumazine synthase [Balneolaceae bacterium]
MAVKELKAEKGDTDFKIGIVVAKWNSFITDELLKGALEALKNAGFKNEQIIVVRCPGAYEIPFTAKKLLPKVDGIVTLGAVIRGETPHFDFVCDAVNRGVMNLNMTGNKPVVFGVLTTDDVPQAQKRSGLNDNGGNKGAEASLALVDMLLLNRQLSQL